MILYQIKCNEKSTGNCLSSATQDRSILDKAKYLMHNNMAASIEAIQQLDDIIFQLAVSDGNRLKADWLNIQFRKLHFVILEFNVC